MKAGKYIWQTYKEVYDIVIRLGNAIRSCGVEPVRNVVPESLGYGLSECVLTY